jgi:hypothetical protein
VPNTAAAAKRRLVKTVAKSRPRYACTVALPTRQIYQ